MGELRKSLFRFHEEPIFDRMFYTKQNHIALGHIAADAVTDGNGSFKLRFIKLVKIEGIPFESFDELVIADWLLRPAFDNNQFKWRVADLDNQVLANDELADEAAIHMAKLFKPELE